MRLHEYIANRRYSSWPDIIRANIEAFDFAILGFEPQCYDRREKSEDVSGIESSADEEFYA